MKKQILILVTNLGVNVLLAQPNPTMQTGQTLPTDGTRTEKNDVAPVADTPPEITKKFNTNYPNIDATWQMDNNNYAANYKDEGTKMGRTIVYDKNGNIVRSDNEISNDVYPIGISDYYKKNYPNETYKVWSSQDNNGNKTYYSKSKTDVIWFDKNGKYIATKSGKSTQKNHTK